MPDDPALIARVGAISCAIPIAHVIETMRPLPIEPVGDAPGFVRGLAIIRGEPTLVIDTARLLGVDAAPPARFVTVRSGTRTLALGFDEVIGVRKMASFDELPPLLRGATPGVVAAIAAADTGFLVLLEAARVLP